MTTEPHFVDRKKLVELFLRVARHIELQENSRDIEGDQHDYGFHVSRHHNYSGPGHAFFINAHTPNIRETEKEIFFPEKKIILQTDGDNEDRKLLHFHLHKAWDTQKKGQPDSDEYEIVDTKTLYDFEDDGELTTEKAAELCFEFAKALSEMSSYSLEDVMGLLDGSKPTFHQRAEQLAAKLV